MMAKEGDLIKLTDETRTMIRRLKLSADGKLSMKK